MKKYALGLDYGTLSVRALFLELDTGREAATAVYEYPHGIMTERLPDGTPLPADFALEHPQDFLDGMECVVRQGMRQLDLSPEQVVGIGLDVTSATVLPVDENAEPLCLKPRFASEPHAWMKLWKHHGAEKIADRLLQTAVERQEPWLPYYGGFISCELFIPKAVELAVKAPEIFAETYNFLEAADWLVWLLTGRMVRSMSLASCTSNYRPDTGYPSKAFFKAAYPEAEEVPDKLKGQMLRLGTCAGYLTEQWAKRLGLRPGIPVGIGTLDAHIGVIGCGASRVGDMVAVIGTSACTMLNTAEGGGIPGIYLGAPDANIPGLYGYEGSQNCVGDMLAWYVENCVPHSYYLQAEAEGKSIHAYLMEKARTLPIGESSLLALDWFNGVRTPLMDYSLTSCIVGLSIHTKPEEIYRALMESAAFGFRRIIEVFENAGKPVERIIAGGGIPGKNPLMMQIYADVCGRTITLCASSQSCALGGAILGAAAAGEAHTGCKDVPALIEKYAKLSDTVYHPIPENAERYQRLYCQYKRLGKLMAQPDSVGRELQKLKLTDIER